MAIDRLSETEIKKIIGHKKSNWKNNQAYYASENTALKRIWENLRSRGISPNNFAPSGYARYIVDIMTGYIASPGYVEYSSENEDYISVINDINNENKEPTVTNQEVRESGIQGEDYELHFIEKDSGPNVMPRFIPVPGNECYPIYTNDLDPKLNVMILSIKRQNDVYEIWIYYKDATLRYILEKDNLMFQDEEPNPYDEVPWNIGRNNICYEPDFKQVEVYIDVIDSLQTNTLNALDKNARAVVLTSLPKDDQVMKDLKNLNIIFDMEKGDDGEGKDFFDYASMELNTDLREHMLDHYINELHKISGIFDFTKLDLGQEPSGTALQYRLFPMQLKASEKVAYRLEFLRQRYKLVTQIINKYTITGSKRISNANINELDITMKLNLPANVKAVLEENMLMSGYVDKTTMIERVPGIDPDQVKKRLEEEQPSGTVNFDDAVLDGEVTTEVTEAAKLSGIQIAAANDIITLVGAPLDAGGITREAGINQLKIFLGLSDAQANLVMGNKETGPATSKASE